MSNSGENTFQPVSCFLEKNAGHVHLIGICGVGMAGLAFLLKSRGFRVTGCDLSPGHMAEWLAARGINVFSQHDPGHIGSDVEWVITSSAVPADCAEVSHAQGSGLPLFSRGLVLSQLLAGYRSVAVGGTHGKTTTTTFITQLLRSAGRDPSWCIGGECDALGGVAGVGRGKISEIRNPKSEIRNIIVVEADESDGTIEFYKPDIAVVTNIEFDHMEHFENRQAFEECFRTFIQNAKQKVVFCLDDPRMRSLVIGHWSLVSLPAVAPSTQALGAKAGDQPPPSRYAGLSRPRRLQDERTDRFLSYGFSEGADVRGRDLRQTASAMNFLVYYRGKELGRVRLPVTGAHNAVNALAAATVALELGLSFDEIRKGLKHVILPRRRFERIVEKDNILVISDYAHHPSEISALVRAAGNVPHSRLLAVFQPHRYTRTLALGRDFPPAFEGIDELILTPVYPAFEKPLKGGTIWDLYALFTQRSEVTRLRPGGFGGQGGQQSEKTGKANVFVAASLEQAWGYIRRELMAGDILMIVGAGDVEKIAGWARDEFGRHKDTKAQRHRGAKDSLMAELRNLQQRTMLLCEVVSSLRSRSRFGGVGRYVARADNGQRTTFRFNEPLANKTSLKVGGKADIWAEISTERDLAMILRWTYDHQAPFNLIGAGSNLLVSDLGVRGITARLAGHEFCSIRESESSETGDTLSHSSTPVFHHSNTPVLVVGAGVTLAMLMNWLEEHGAAGLELLEGIPGTVGGALRMNAGAWGHEVGRYVSWIRCFNMDGSECILGSESLGLGYRRCDCLKERVFVEAGLAVEWDEPLAIRKRRHEIAARREWMKGLRSVGSVFKNPASSARPRRTTEPLREDREQITEGKSAGWLIEHAGLKGLTIGGATISEAHANVITVSKEACASDVRALIEKVRGEIASRFGIQLETEVVFLGDN